jgi:hypothetical protein
VEVVAWSAQGIPTAVTHGFVECSRCFFSQTAPDPRLLRKSSSAGNRSRNLCVCVCMFVDLRGGQSVSTTKNNVFRKFNSPCYVPNTVIGKDFQISTFKEEIRHYSSRYRARFSVHPNNLVVNLMAQPDNRRLRRHTPSLIVLFVVWSLRFSL